MDRETKQLELKRARSESQPAGREGLRQERNPVEVARREPVRQRKQKGKQDQGEQRTGSRQHRVAGREKTQTGVGACSESGKRQTLNEEPSVTRLRLPPKRGWLRELQQVLGAFEQYLSQSQILVDRLPELSGKVFYCHRQADPCHADALVRAWEQIEHGPPMTVAHGVRRNLKRLFARFVENGMLSLIGLCFEIKILVEINLHCIASVVSTVPIATLDHLRGRGEDLRCILPLPQPASLSEAEIALRNLVETTPHMDRAQHLWKETEQVRPFPSWHSQNGKQDYGLIFSIYLNGFTEFEFKHWDDLVICSCGQFQSLMQEAYKQWNVPRQEAKALTRQLAIEDLGCHIDGVFGAVPTPHPFDVSLGAATLWLLSQNRPQHMD